VTCSSCKLTFPEYAVSVEDLFEQELRRRGLDPTRSQDEGSDPAAQPRSPFKQQQQRRPGPRPPPSFRQDEEEVPPQLAKSRALNSEGLEVGLRGCWLCLVDFLLDSHDFAKILKKKEKPGFCLW
jgi:hypothetical protein